MFDKLFVSKRYEIKQFQKLVCCSWRSECPLASPEGVPQRIRVPLMHRIGISTCLFACHCKKSSKLCMLYSYYFLTIFCKFAALCGGQKITEK